MTTKREKIRKLRALAKSPNKHEAALALAKAEALEARMRPTTAKAIAHAVAQLLEARGMKVRVKPRVRADESALRPKVDADVRYFVSRDRRSKHQIKIEIIEYELFNG
jgi:hypothetical protein